MSIVYKPIFQDSSTVTNASDINTQPHYLDGSVRIQTIESNSRTYASTLHGIYEAILPTNINVIAKAAEKIATITNSVVKEQTIYLLTTLNSSLQVLTGDNDICNRLPLISLIERDDQSVLLEWNFEYFRVGFSIEVEKDESNYYIIAEDPDKGSFIAEIHRLGENYADTIKTLTDFVIRNT